MVLQCLQAYGIVLENTEYGESDLIYGYGHVVKMADSECASPSRSLSSSTLTLSACKRSEHESTSYASSSLGHLRPPQRKKGKSMGTGKSKSIVGVFDVVLKNTEIGYKNTEIRRCAY